MVIGLLIVVALMIFALARIVGNRTQLRDAYADPKFAASTEERVRPFVRVAVAGKKNSTLEISAPPHGAGRAPSLPTEIPALYKTVWRTRPATRLAGAPKIAPHSPWG